MRNNTLSGNKRSFSKMKGMSSNETPVDVKMNRLNLVNQLADKRQGAKISSFPPLPVNKKKLGISQLISGQSQ
tara:strand:- start:6 stop:224 length:219 start_codon:yes stop_codon:yes gene_type:complete